MYKKLCFAVGIAVGIVAMCLLGFCQADEVPDVTKAERLVVNPHATEVHWTVVEALSAQCEDDFSQKRNMTKYHEICHDRVDKQCSCFREQLMVLCHKMKENELEQCQKIYLYDSYFDFGRDDGEGRNATQILNSADRDVYLKHLQIYSGTTEQTVHDEPFVPTGNDSHSSVFTNPLVKFLFFLLVVSGVAVCVVCCVPRKEQASEDHHGKRMKDGETNPKGAATPLRDLQNPIARRFGEDGYHVPVLERFNEDVTRQMNSLTDQELKEVTQQLQSLKLPEIDEVLKGLKQTKQGNKSDKIHRIIDTPGGLAAAKIAIEANEKTKERVKAGKSDVEQKADAARAAAEETKRVEAEAAEKKAAEEEAADAAKAAEEKAAQDAIHALQQYSAEIQSLLGVQGEPAAVNTAAEAENEDVSVGAKHARSEGAELHTEPTAKRCALPSVASYDPFGTEAMNACMDHSGPSDGTLGFFENC